MNERRRHLMRLAPLAIVGFALFVALGGAAVRWLWNWLLPPLFGWPTLTFWQALGLLALCRILVGGFGLQGSPRGRWLRRPGGPWADMTPEERECFRRGLHGAAGAGPAAPGQDTWTAPARGAREATDPAGSSLRATTPPSGWIRA